MITDFEEFKLTEAVILSLQPNDIICMKVKYKCNDKMYAYLSESLGKVLPEGVKVVILEEGAELSIIRVQEELDASNS